ncbi:AP-2 complex subunit mu, variant 2 [Balamuthia mandrillaris]
MLQPLGPAAKQAAAPPASSGSARSNEVASFSAFSLSASSPALSLSASSANKRALRHSRIPRKNDDVDLSYLLEKVPIASASSSTSTSSSSSSSSSSSASTPAKPSLKHSRIPRRTDDVDLSYLLEKVPVASPSSASRPSLTDLPPVIPRSYKGHQKNGPSSSSTLTLSPAVPTLKPLGKGPGSGPPLLMTGTTIGGFASSSSSSSSSKTKQPLPKANVERINLNNTKTATTAAESETKEKEAGESATELESLPLMSSPTAALQKVEGGDKSEDTCGVDRFVSPLSPRQRGLGKGRFGQRTNPSKAFEAPYIENPNHKPLSLNNSPSLSSAASTSTPASSSSSSSATTVTVASWKGQALALLNETQRQILTSSAQEWLKADSLCTNFNFDRRKQERRKFYLQKYAMKSNRRVKASKAIRLEEDKRERDREAAARAAAAAITAANGKEAEGMHASEETIEPNSNHYFYGNIKLEGKDVAVVASSSPSSSASSSASSSNAGSPFLMLKEGTRGGKKQKPLFDHNVKKKKKKKKKNLEDDPTEVFGGIKGSNIGGLTKSADLSHIKIDFIARARKEVLERERAAAAKATVEDKKEEEPTTRKRRNTSTKKEEKTKEKQGKEEEFDEPPPLKEKKKKKNKMGVKKKKDASDQTEANDEKHKKKKTKKKDPENSADKISSQEKKKKKKNTKETVNAEGKQRETKKRSKFPPLLKSKTQNQLLQSSNDSNDTANSSNGDDNVLKTKSSTVTLCRSRSPNSERLHKEKEADKEEIIKEKNVNEEGDESEDEDDTTRKLWFDIEADEYDLLGSKEEEYEPFTSGSKIWTRAKLKLRRASLGSSSYASNSVGWIGRAAAKHNQHKNFNKDRIQRDERRTRSNSISSSPTEKQNNNTIRKNMDELLPMSLWALIVQWLKPMDFLVLSLVSKRFFVLADEALLWKKIHERQWGAFSIVHYTKYGKLFWEEDLDINQWKRAALVREGSLRPTDPSPQYEYNEIFCDIIEHLNVIFSPDGQVKKASLNGALILKCVLSGLPTVHLKFKAKPVQADVNTSSVSDYEMVLDDLTMHPCVTSADLADQTVSFVPPDCKQFELLKYRILDSAHLNIPFQVAFSFFLLLLLLSSLDTLYSLFSFWAETKTKRWQ